MVDQDPYDWTMSIAGLTSGSRALQSEQVTLTLTKENGSWVPTDGAWDISYSNGPNISEIHVTESYTHKKMPISLPADALDGGTVKLSAAGTHPDGQIISLTPINALNIPDFYTSLKAYKMTYWSQNIPVVAYIALPEQTGTYPLLKVATEQSGIRSVIAESPWVGANLVDTWYLSHEQSTLPHVKGIYHEMVYDYGTFGTGKSIYQKHWYAKYGEEAP